MYSKRLCKGYRIIDDYSKKAYGREIAERLEMHLNYYEDPFQYENIRTEYKCVLEKNKEIDFDEILLVSEKLLASCTFIRSNIASVISSILVDEFQDTNELQYTILSYIYKANKSITLMFVGDVNQAIYTSLGGVAKEKKELEALYGTSDIQSYDVLSAVNCCRHIDADGIICLSVAIQKVFALLNICVSKESSLSELKASFFDEICSRVKRYSLATDFESISKYFGDKNAVVISTLHGVKGEEYTTVIAAGLFIVTGQSPSLFGMDEMLQEWKGADQFIIVKGTWFEKLMAE